MRLEKKQWELLSNKARILRVTALLYVLIILFGVTRSNIHEEEEGAFEDKEGDGQIQHLLVENSQLDAQEFFKIRSEGSNSRPAREGTDKIGPTRAPIVTPFSLFVYMFQRPGNL